MTIMQSNNGQIILLNGWQRGVAKRMGVHYNTIYNILQRGEKHPKYARVMKIAIENFSKK